MNEQKKPQAGEWWFATNNPGDRLYIVGQCDAGRTVFQYSKGGQLMIDRDGNWKNWHHEPRCTGWDWQPEPEPEWFDLTPHDGHVLRKDVDQIDFTVGYVPVNASRGITVSAVRDKYGGHKFRCLLKDAPPELLKPVESPDDWVTQDRVPMRGSVDQRRWVDRYGVAGGWGEDWLTTVSHGYVTGSGHRLELRCRRKDLPPIPEPKPATQTIVFHEVILRHELPKDHYTMSWMSEVPKHPNWIPTGRTETREVVR